MANDWRQTVDAVIELQAHETMKTAPGPSLQWYPGQWLSDAAVSLMDLTAQGAHHHLLMLAWKGFDLDGEDAVPCSLPDDLDLIRALCRHPSGWEDIWRQVVRGWRLHRGRYWNLGLCRSYLTQMARRRTNKQNADARWDAVRNGSDGNATAPESNATASDSDATASESQCSSSSSSSSSSIREEESPTDSGADAPGANGEPRKLTPHQENMRHLVEDVLIGTYDQQPPKKGRGKNAPPDYKVLTKWLKTAGSMEKLEAALEQLHGSDKMGNWSYLWKVLPDWCAPKGKNRQRTLEEDPEAKYDKEFGVAY